MTSPHATAAIVSLQQMAELTPMLSYASLGFKGAHQPVSLAQHLQCTAARPWSAGSIPVGGGNDDDRPPIMHAIQEGQECGASRKTMYGALLDACTFP